MRTAHTLHTSVPTDLPAYLPPTAIFVYRHAYCTYLHLLASMRVKRTYIRGYVRCIRMYIRMTHVCLYELGRQVGR